MSRFNYAYIDDSYKASLTYLIGLYVALFFAGALLVTAFAPLHWWPFGILSPLLLLATWMRSTTKQAMLTGALFGLGLFSVGASWVFISIHTYGHANIFTSAIITTLFITLLSAYFAAFGYCFNTFFRKNETLAILLAFPCLWVLFEGLRCTLFTGFPWLLLGYTQTTAPLFGFGAIFGVYGLSFIIALLSACLLLVIMHQTWQQCALAIGVILIIVIGGWMADNHRYTQPLGKPLTATLVQGNISQNIKWDDGSIEKIIRTYQRLTQPYWNSNLIIWPEAAIPTLLQNIPNTLKTLQTKAIENHTTLITGLPIYEPLSRRYFNALLAINTNTQVYLKYHLVPFGEFFPLKRWLSWAYKAVDIPLSNLSPGNRIQPDFTAGGIQIAPFICYEIGFSNEVVDALGDANAIVVASDDSWFGDSLAASQHLQMAQMRAIETGRPVLFASNSGPSAIISARGIISAESKRDRAIALNGLFIPTQGETPFMLMHYNLMNFIMFLLLLACLAVKQNPLLKQRSLY